MLDPLSLGALARVSAQRVWALQAATATMLPGLLAMVPFLTSKSARSCVKLMGAAC